MRETYNKHEYVCKCDICNKPMDKWDGMQLLKRWYTPGKNFDKVSSNIDAHVKKIIDICPDCLKKLEKGIERLKEKRDV